MRKILVIIATSLLVLAGAPAAVVWTNPITGTNPNTANPYSTGQTVAANLSVIGIGRGAGITGNAANDRYNANSWNTASLDTTAYFTFTLDAANGFELDLTSFVYTSQASGTGATTFAFRSSVDNFATNIGTPTATGTTINLSAAQFQNLTSPVEFRLYGWGASAAAGTFSVNDFTFNGALAAAVPEPREYAFGITALLAALLIARSRLLDQARG